MRRRWTALAVLVSMALISGCVASPVPTAGSDSWSGEAIRRAAAEQSPAPETLFTLCETMALYGEYVGDARAAGVPVNVAMTDATERLVRQTSMKHGDSLDLNARVFAVLAYRLDADQAPQTVGAYTLFACMAIHGLKKTMPVDVRSEKAINEQLRTCAGSASGRDGLGACVIRRLAPMVKQGA